MRVLIGLLVVALLAVAAVIYQVKYEARGLEARVQELKKEIQDERDAIAVLRAEWSLLNRPERVERLARKHLGLEPLAAQRIITIEDLDTRTPPLPPMAGTGRGGIVGPAAGKPGPPAIVNH